MFATKTHKNARSPTVAHGLTWVNETCKKNQWNQALSGHSGSNTTLEIA
jgi:hypothetical protein